ncbi:MAG: hypothetical protein ACKVHP_13255, partial [Verrucomicrobiales bacterium]
MAFEPMSRSILQGWLQGPIKTPILACCAIVLAVFGLHTWWEWASSSAKTSNVVEGGVSPNILPTTRVASGNGTRGPSQRHQDYRAAMKRILDSMINDYKGVLEQYGRNEDIATRTELNQQVKGLEREISAFQDRWKRFLTNVETAEKPKAVRHMFVSMFVSMFPKVSVQAFESAMYQALDQKGRSKLRDVAERASRAGSSRSRSSIIESHGRFHLMEVIDAFTYVHRGRQHWSDPYREEAETTLKRLEKKYSLGPAERASIDEAIEYTLDSAHDEPNS